MVWAFSRGCLVQTAIFQHKAPTPSCPWTCSRKEALCFCLQRKPCSFALLVYRALRQRALCVQLPLPIAAHRQVTRFCFRNISLSCLIRNSLWHITCRGRQQCDGTSLGWVSKLDGGCLGRAERNLGVQWETGQPVCWVTDQLWGQPLTSFPIYKLPPRLIPVLL